MTQRKRSLLAVMLALAAAVSGGPAVAAGGPTATLDGRPLRLDRVAEFNCHDFEYPVIRCFTSSEALSVDIDERLAGRAGAGILAGGYVTVWQDNLYGGPSISLSLDYPFLSAIGWNDRISSFKSFGANGNFRENSPGGGLYYAYGASTQISSLGSANDLFSAFYID